jgi:hypothetical protein
MAQGDVLYPLRINTEFLDLGFNDREGRPDTAFNNHTIITQRKVSGVIIGPQSEKVGGNDSHFMFLVAHDTVSFFIRLGLRSLVQPAALF